MLDPLFRRLIDPPLNRAAEILRPTPLRANHLTWLGFACGLVAVAAVASGRESWALLPFVLNRGLDGLDGALARQRGSTDLGGFLDIVLDFGIYGLLGLAFAWGDPSRALSAAFLLASFLATASSFLAYAIVAAKQGLVTTERGDKAFYHLGGLAEGTETIVFFVAAMVWPDWFAALAWVYGGICWLTAIGRLRQGLRDFSA